MTTVADLINLACRKVRVTGFAAPSLDELNITLGDLREYPMTAETPPLRKSCLGCGADTLHRIFLCDRWDCPFLGHNKGDADVADNDGITFRNGVPIKIESWASSTDKEKWVIVRRDNLALVDGDVIQGSVESGECAVTVHGQSVAHSFLADGFRFVRRK